MADAAKFDIAINAQEIGVNSSADSLVALAASLRTTDAAATKFDAAVAAASVHLKAATEAATSAAQALSAAESRYSELERSANKAALAVEKAAKAGKDTAALKVQADSAAAAMRKQASAVDDLRAKSQRANGAQESMAGTLKVLEKAQKDATKTQKQQGEGADIFALKSKFLGNAYVRMALAVVGIASAAAIAVVSLGKMAIANRPDVQMRLALAQERYARAVKAIFKDLKFDKFLNGLEDTMALFDEGRSTATGMKTIMSSLLQPLLDMAPKVLPILEQIFKGMIIGTLKVIIAIKTLRNNIVEAIPKETRVAIVDFVSSLADMETAMQLGEIAAVSLAVVVGLIALAVLLCFAQVILFTVAILIIVKAVKNWDKASTALKVTAIALGLVIAILMLPIWPLIAIIALIVYAFENWTVVGGILKVVLITLAICMALLFLPLILLIGVIWLIYEAITNWTEITDTIKQVWDDLVDGAADAASDLIDGFVDGIKKGATWVYDAISNLADGAVSKFKSILGIHSPSTVFRLQAHYSAQGYVEGLEAEQPNVDKAVSNLASGASGAANSGGGGNSLVRSVTINNLVINAASGEASDIETAVRHALNQVLAGVAISIGAGEVPA